MNIRNPVSITLCLFAATAFTSPAVLAAAPKAPAFKALDTNHDGYVEANEAKQNATVARNFKILDTNGDGRISKNEYQALVNAMRDQSNAAQQD